MSKGFRIIETFSPEELQNVSFNLEKGTPFIINKNNINYTITTNNDTKKIFRAILNNPICSSCGIKGNIFILRQDPLKNYHLGLFHITRKLKLIQLTIDHIVPKSLGGTNNIENYQTLCYDCNQEKGHWLLTPKQLNSIIELKKILARRQRPRRYIRENLSEIKSALSNENKVKKFAKFCKRETPYVSISSVGNVAEI